MTHGDITIDEAYVHWFRNDRFDLALGRMQTKFVARGGVDISYLPKFVTSGARTGSSHSTSEFDNAKSWNNRH